MTTLADSKVDVAREATIIEGSFKAGGTKARRVVTKKIKVK